MRLLTAFLLSCGVGLVGMPVYADSDRLDHRDDYAMDSLSGGAFRDYISEHIVEEDDWAHAARTFGSFHNFMHEMMTTMARHAVEERGDERFGEVGQRVSGGDWRNYRKALEADGDSGAWAELVQVTEIMHDRVHHAMARTVILDQARNERDADLADYLRGEPLEPGGEGVPDIDALNHRTVSLDEFRQFAWQHDTDHRHWHGAVEQLNAFAVQLDDLLAQWIAVGSAHAEPTCRPPAAVAGGRGEVFTDYAAAIVPCPDADWRELVEVASLMRDRIHHMLYKAVHYRT